MITIVAWIAGTLGASLLLLLLLRWMGDRAQRQAYSDSCFAQMLALSHERDHYLDGSNPDRLKQIDAELKRLYELDARIG
jgi:hypothetical protein